MSSGGSVGGGRCRIRPSTTATTKITRKKMTNSTCAMLAAVDATPPNPSMPATMAMIGKTMAE